MSAKLFPAGFWGFALLIFAAFISSVFFFIPAFYTSDDVIINATVSGVFGHPDAHVVYPSYFLGWILKSLYSGFPLIPWVGIFYYAAYFFDWLLVTYILCRRFENTWIAASIMILLFLMIGIFLLNILQFTLVAGFTALCGLWLFVSFYKDLEGKKLVLLTSLSLCYLVTGFLFRDDACFLVVFLFIPYFLFDLLMGSEHKKLFLKQLSFGTAFCLAAGILFFVNGALVNKDKNWKEAMEFHELSVYFTDYITPFSKEAADKVGWTLNDYVLLRKGFFVDSAVFTKAKLAEYLRLAPTHISRKSGILSGEFSKNQKQNEGQNISGYDPGSITVGCFKEMESGSEGFIENYLLSTLAQCQRLMLFIFALLLFTKGNHGKIFSIMVWALVLFAGFAFFLKPLPIRVAYVMLYALILMMISFIDLNEIRGFLSSFRSKNKWNLKKIIRIGGLVIFSFLLFSGVRGIKNYHKESIDRSREVGSLKQYYGRFRKENPKKIFFAFRPRHGIGELMLPFDKQAPAFMKELDLLPISNITEFPFFTDHLKEKNILNPATDLIDRKDMLIFSSGYSLELFHTFVKEHYHRDIGFELLDKKFGLYRVENINPGL